MTDTADGRSWPKWRTADLTASRDLVRVLRAHRMRMTRGNCYVNAFRALPHAPEGSLFVIGHATCPNREPIEHAWIETPDQRILDVTPPDVPEAVYRAVKRLTSRDLVQATDSRGGWRKVCSLDRPLDADGTENAP